MYENFKEYVAGNDTAVPLGELDVLLENYPWFATARMMRWMQYDLPSPDPLVDFHLLAAPVPSALLQDIDGDGFGLRTIWQRSEPAATVEAMPPSAGEEPPQAAESSQEQPGSQESVVIPDEVAAIREDMPANEEDAGQPQQAVRVVAEQIEALQEEMTEMTESAEAESAEWREAAPQAEPEQSCGPQPVAEEQKPAKSADELIIDTFLGEAEYRITPAEETSEEDIATPTITQPMDIMTEQLAAIYMQQQLWNQAKEAYEKLSLVYPEKSVYFAEILAHIEKQRNNN